MRAINLDGDGVHEMFSDEEFKLGLVKQFTVAKQGTCAIVVKDKREAMYILREFSAYAQKIHDLTGEQFETHRTRWNLLTVEESKGLEFGTVFAVSGRMTENEKYISYTRALDELFVYDTEIIFPSWVFEEERKAKEESEKKKKKRTEKKKTIETNDAKIGKSRKSQITVKSFFENNEIKVIDWRNETGELWVVGGKRQIGKIVEEACNKFGIEGQYAISNATGMKPGWVTRTDK